LTLVSNLRDERMPQKSILITGCSSGIGHDAAHRLHRRGWRVFASCRAEEDCVRLRAEGLDSPRLDYADEASIRACLDEVLQKTGGTLDAVFNNGAFGIPGAVEDVPRAALREIFETNLFGPHDLTRAVIPVMRAQGYGRIVNCSSVLGYTCYPWRGAYVATKYGMEGLTDTLRNELRGSPIHVILIEPGLITTKFGQNSGKNFDRWIDWETSVHAGTYRAKLLPKRDGANPNARLEVPASAVTEKLIRALEDSRPRPRYKVTRLAHVADLLRRLLPTRATDWIIRRTS
jgi:NAD(P)-dependent dehydrogenase (short-subunit alcohol dehydrogenase family)